MNQSNNLLWQCYQDVEFLFSQPLSSDISFAIITAHNPKGQILTSCQNRLLDRKLQYEIEQLRQPYRAMMGTSLDRSHMEKSWAVSTDKNSAMILGRKFQQNAIYFVEHDKLQLIPCLFSPPQYQEQIIGHFSSRVSLVNELPDFV
ncbi:DUF3293 domain-containing protein [Shewanella sp. D64]|uniref:DUF3293 domain-containing protein n=1 Tax=unclassified Shewanella TaxID=196818 RepID=UPI0022BA1155|nr:MULTISPECIES: DUF3293 domain-containing protein [unclassified Shewanella]MEC4728892.1 DUF3293 domain-containing protein [Shewanella sp. D64]MEC4740766.1 DUF3293 domain-containing protein [Shewanella sp. E94]WBJ94492.1 DUF3293 domain-containing protein [Shewanella sp. MTB7]